MIAIEIDPVLVQYLRAEFRDEPRLTIVDGDVLKIDLAQFDAAVVAGNLPYYITSPILSKTLALGNRLARAVFLVQKEVADRLIASPGTRDCGFLSVQTQLLSTPELLFTVPAAAFRPPPKVDSAVVQLIPKPDSPALDRAAFLKFVGRCFHQKRKKIRNNLAGMYDLAFLDSIPAAARRAEQLSIPEFLALFDELSERGHADASSCILKFMLRVRFAPSPTGYLHIGSARTFIFNWLYARRNRGTMILRIDDTDVERNTQESLDSIFEGLKWLDLSWDEFYRQSSAASCIRRPGRFWIKGSRIGISHRRSCRRGKIARRRDAWLFNPGMREMSKEESDLRANAGEPFVLRFRVPARMRRP